MAHISKCWGKLVDLLEKLKYLGTNMTGKRQRYKVFYLFIYLLRSTSSIFFFSLFCILYLYYLTYDSINLINYYLNKK